MNYEPACEAAIGVLTLIACVTLCLFFGYAAGRADYLDKKWRSRK